jgi:hypothetical protein
MVKAGFAEITVHATLEVITDADRYRALSPRPLTEQLQKLVQSYVISEERAEAYAADQDAREADGRFLVSLPIYCVAGVKPIGPVWLV